MTAVIEPTTHSRSLDRPARLSRRTRRAVLTIHLIGAGGWIGIDVVLAVLVFTARSTEDVSTEAIAYQALELFAFVPLFTAGLVTLLSGVVLGFGTPYRVFKHWWVATKLVINLVLLTLITFSLRGAVSKADSYGDALAAGTAPDVSVSRLVMPPIVSSTGLLIATVLSVYKPWGPNRSDGETRLEVRDRSLKLTAVTTRRTSPGPAASTTSVLDCARAPSRRTTTCSGPRLGC